MRLLPVLVALAGPAHAGDTLDRDAYEARHSMRDYAGSPHQAALDRCLWAWGDHPFTAESSRRYRLIEPSVRVLGVGSQTADTDATSYPQLVLLRPSVSVMAKTTWELSNPNGWYCFDTTVTVLAKGVVELACGARLADARDGVAVVASNDQDKKGVSVLGKTEVRRAACP